MSSPEFLIRAAREFRRGGWVFTGFHWPVLAGQLAHALDGERFIQVFEAGAGCWGAAADIPTSTTDYPAYANTIGWSSNSVDVLLAMASRFDRVVLDASNVDVLGRVNSSFLGSRERPRVRLPGGGGAPDVAARAWELVWLHGGTDLRRIQDRVEHVTAAPGPGTTVALHTRWGVVRLRPEPYLAEVDPETPGVDEFTAHLRTLGVPTGTACLRSPVTEAQRQAATEVLEAAARRGYAAARRTVDELEHTP